MGYTTDAAVYEAVTIGIVNFVFALVAVLLLDWIGRKVLLIVSTAGMVAALAAEGWYWSQGSSYAHANGIIGLGLTLAFLAFFELGMGPVTWVLIAEIYPLRVRSKAMAIATMVNWTFNFLVSYFYLTMFKPGVFGRDGTMWFFAGFALIALVCSPSGKCPRPRTARWRKSRRRCSAAGLPKARPARRQPDQGCLPRRMVIGWLGVALLAVGTAGALNRGPRPRGPRARGARAGRWSDGPRSSR